MNVSKMSTEQVNEAIAKLRGEWLCPGHRSDITYVTPYRRGIFTVGAPSDYCHDWQAAGPLLVEMCEASSMDVAIWHGKSGWHCVPTIHEREVHGHGAELPEAVSRAYAQWKGADK